MLESEADGNGLTVKFKDELRFPDDEADIEEPPTTHVVAVAVSRELETVEDRPG